MVFMKKPLVILLSAFALPFTAVVGQVNTSDLNAYVAQNYFGGIAMDHSRELFSNATLNGNGVSLDYTYAETETGEAPGRRFEAELGLDIGSLAYSGSTSNFNYGIAVSYLSSALDSIGTDTNPNVALATEGDGWVTGVGFAFPLERWAFSLHASMGEISFDSTRVNGQFSPKTSTFDIEFYSISTRIDYLLKSFSKSDLSTFLELGYQTIENGGFTESNSPDFVTIGTFEEDGSFGEFGFDYIFRASETIDMSFTVSILQDLGDGFVRYTGTDSISSSVVSTVNDPAETIIKAEAGTYFTFSDQASADLRLAYGSGEDRDDLSIGLSFVYDF